MRVFILSLFFLIALPVSFSQTVADQKEAERLYRASVEDTKYARLYFDEDEKCRTLLRMGSYADAEVSCQRALNYVEKLPAARAMEKYSAYKSVGIALLWQKKSDEAIVCFNKALEAGKTKLDDTDSETAEIYFRLGQANHLAGKTAGAREYYTKAENSYRAAFKKIGDSEIAGFYPPRIKSILETHLSLLENYGTKDEAEKMRQHLAEFMKEFAKFL